MIELSVALPVWNSKEILWLAMEGLCNQRNIDFEWELLIAEEQINELGVDALREYIPRLEAIGCSRFAYFPLDYRIPLPQKWRLLADKVTEGSKVFLLQAADCYSEPLRLRRTLDYANEGFDWIQNRKGCYYSLHYKKTIEFDQSTFGEGCKTGLNMAVSTKLLDRLPGDSFIPFGVDNWFYKSVKPERVLWVEGDMDGIDVDGQNNISLRRKSYFIKPEKPFVATEIKLEELIPHHIATRLKTMKPK